MCALKRTVNIALVVLLSTTAFLFTGNGPVQAVPTQVVTVANTPLPVSGTVSVSNLPTTQAITGSVTITGTPTVQIASGASNAFRAGVAPLYPVGNPGNKLLVIDQVDGLLGSSQFNGTAAILSAGGIPQYIPPVFQNIVVDGKWVFHAQTKIYVQPGEWLYVTNIAESASLYLIGHYEQ